VHRALQGLVVQFGDPQSRDVSKQEEWGRGAAASSGHPIGAVEIAKNRVHRKGAVGVAHMGDPSKADSQIYVTLANRPDLDGHYAVFGQVIAGDDVPAKLQVGDTITRMYVKE
jgi:peptidyl-prolyl cis-trans isomerase B (cyclophilin B)